MTRQSAKPFLLIGKKITRGCPSTHNSRVAVTSSVFVEFYIDEFWKSRITEHFDMHQTFLHKSTIL